MHSVKRTIRTAVEDTVAGVIAALVIGALALAAGGAIVLASRHLPEWLGWVVAVVVLAGPWALDMYFSV